nr:GntR family transcriptional regulator [uncultured Agathobaculum sp.]
MAAKRPIQTMGDQVYTILRKDICEGRFAPGARLQEIELSEALGVSRSPVREALRRLVSDGLLLTAPNKGTYVKEFTCQDIDEIFDMRVMLESYSISRSQNNMTPERKQQLYDILQVLERSHAEDNLEQYTRADEELHNAIVALGDNSLVNSTYARVRSMNQQFRVFSLSDRTRFDDSLQEHRSIIHALVHGDTAEADRINRVHLELACQCIKDQLRKNGTA